MLKPIGAAVAAWRPNGRQRVDPLAELAALWPTIVGERLAAQTRPIELRDGALVIATRSSVWSHELSFFGGEILARLAALGVPATAIRFRVGRIGRRQTSAAGPRESPRAAPAPRPPLAADAPIEAVVARLRAGIERSLAGQRRCADCGAVARGDRCAPCSGRRRGERIARVERIMYETPWLGFAAAQSAVPDLGGEEYEAARRDLLSRWWAQLQRARARRTVRADGYESRIAMSYVLLQTRMQPDAVSSQVVRNLLGAELADLLFTIGADVGKAPPKR